MNRYIKVVRHGPICACLECVDKLATAKRILNRDPCVSIEDIATPMKNFVHFARYGREKPKLALLSEGVAP